jgi:hypothetical protein
MALFDQVRPMQELVAQKRMNDGATEQKGRPEVEGLQLGTVF